jgi:hypothetical protein
MTQTKVRFFFFFFFFFFLMLFLLPVLKASHDNDALACKAVALMHLGRYEEASKIAAGDQLAYCLYKLKRYDEALAKTSSPLLRAQALFKLGRFKV